MSLLYKEEKDIKYNVDFTSCESTGTIIISFYNDGGKHGTDELLDVIEITPKELLIILQERI